MAGIVIHLSFSHQNCTGLLNWPLSLHAIDSSCERDVQQAYVGWSSAFGDAVNSYHPTSYKLSTETAYELKDDRTIQVDIPESTEKRTITKYYVKAAR
eukprot:5186516-Amphidinium_carterae.1